MGFDSGMCSFVEDPLTPVSDIPCKHSEQPALPDNINHSVIVVARSTHNLDQGVGGYGGRDSVFRAVESMANTPVVTRNFLPIKGCIWVGRPSSVPVCSAVVKKVRG
jgi:hypothetical protein